MNSPIFVHFISSTKAPVIAGAFVLFNAISVI